MNANYKPKVNSASVGLFPGMSYKEARAWDLTAKYRMMEYSAMGDVMIMSILYYLAIEEGRGAVWAGLGALPPAPIHQSSHCR